MEPRFLAAARGVKGRIGGRITSCSGNKNQRQGTKTLVSPFQKNPVLEKLGLPHGPLLHGRLENLVGRGGEDLAESLVVRSRHLAGEDG